MSEVPEIIRKVFGRVSRCLTSQTLCDSMNCFDKVLLSERNGLKKMFAFAV
jgi:hypothetical protein